jgi:hypothetical protein
MKRQIQKGQGKILFNKIIQMLHLIRKLEFFDDMQNKIFGSFLLLKISRKRRNFEVI